MSGVCVCLYVWWVGVPDTVPVTPVSTSINTHVKNCIASLYIEWSPLAATPFPPPPLLEPNSRIVHLHVLVIRPCHQEHSIWRKGQCSNRHCVSCGLGQHGGEGGSETMDTHTAKKMRRTNLRVSGQSFPSQYQTCARSHQFHPLQSDGHLDSEYAKEAG